MRMVRFCRRALAGPARRTILGALLGALLASSDACAPPAAQRSHVASIRGVYAGFADTVLAHVAPVFDDGMGPAERASLRALVERTMPDFDGDAWLRPGYRMPRAERRLRVVFRGREQDVRLRLTYAGDVNHDYEFVTADTTLAAALRDALRDALRAADLALIAPLDRGVTLQIVEQLPPAWTRDRMASRVPYVLVTTEDVFPCSNLLVEGTARRVGHEITLTLDGMRGGPQECDNGFGNAHFADEQPLPAGRYDLHVVLRRSDSSYTRDSYTLTVTDSVITFAPVAGRASRVITPRVPRRPPLTMAYYCDLGLDGSRATTCEQFARVLRDSLGATALAFPTPADVPYPVRGGVPRDEVRYFHYRAPEDFRRAYDLLQAFGRVHLPGDGTGRIELVNWRDVHISSYVCRSYQDWCRETTTYPPW